MSGPVIRRPAVESNSVLDSPMEKAIKALARFIGGDDPNSQVLGMLNPTEVAAGPVAKAIATLAKRLKPIKAYHGSPHDFDQFKLEKIGTGEGAQAYGHGLYFAEKEAVAKEYRDQLGGVKSLIGKDVYDSSRPDHLAASLVHTYRNSPDPTATAIKELTHDVNLGVLDPKAIDRYRQTIEILKAKTELPPKATVPAGRMYEVNIHADPDDFLDWDAPLSQQSEKVKKAIEPAVARGNQGYRNRVTDHFMGPDPTGRQAYEAAGNLRELLFKQRGVTPAGKEGATELFKEKGIPGIKYYDGASRGRNNDWVVTSGSGMARSFPDEASAKAAMANIPDAKLTAPTGTRNYVVFDEKLIEIVKKYGIAVATAGGLINEMQAQQLREQGYQ